MEIQRVSGNTWCIAGHQTIPLYMLDDRHCIMLDTGGEYERQKIEACLTRADITPIGLLCTHTHFDHFGNAKYFSRRYGCPVALPLGEAEICRTQASVKSHLFVFSAGQIANDPKMAAIPCLVDHVIRPEEQFTMFRGVLFKVLHTPGHSMDHVSYITPDNVLYAGDALMGGKSLSASKLPYAFHIRQSLDTMGKLRGLKSDAVIMAHGGVITGDYDALVEDNIRVTLEQLAAVRRLVSHAMSAQDICKAVQRELGVVVATPEKAQNLERFLRPYMECMVDDGTHCMVIRDGVLCYEPCDGAHPAPN